MRSTRLRRRIATAAAIAVAAPLAFAASSQAETIYAVDNANNVLTFDSATPGTIASTNAITGLEAGENVLALDVRPATGQLYALGSTSRIYTIAPASGAATAISATPFTPALDGTDFGFDFNPIPDAIRIVSDNEQSLRVSPTTGQVLGTDTALAPAGNVLAAGYTNNAPGTSETTLFGIDSAADTLVRIGGPGGAPSPNGGALTTIRALGADVGGNTSLDFSQTTNQGYAAATVGGTTSLFIVDASGAQDALINEGVIGLGLTPIRGLAAAAAPPSVRFAGGSFAVAEDGANATITVLRSGDLSGASTVNLSTGTTGTATAGVDFTAQTNTVVSFAAGQASATAQVPIANDTEVETDETVALTLAAPSAGTGLAGPNAATLTIYDEDAAPAPPADAPPTVEFGTNPSPGTLISGRRATTLTFTASADTTGVTMFSGGVQICNDTTAPFTCDLTPTTRDVGYATLVAVATDAANQKAIGTRTIVVNRLSPPSVSLKATPTRDRTSPYSFTASGLLGRTNAQRIKQECAGTVVVSFTVGSVTTSKSARVASDCKYSAKVSLRTRGLVKVKAAFAGNSVYSSRSSATRSVRAGS